MEAPEPVAWEVLADEYWRVFATQAEAIRHLDTYELDDTVIRPLYAAPPCADLVPQWQPIETAPKDGTTMIGYWCNRLVEPTRACNYTLIRYDQHDDVWLTDADEESEGPTHWMPLPEPPGEKT